MSFWRKKRSTLPPTLSSIGPPANQRARWFAGGPMELKVGGKVDLFFRQKDMVPDEVPPAQFAAMHETGKRKSCTILRCEPPYALSYTFDDESDVTFELIPQ